MNYLTFYNNHRKILQVYRSLGAKKAIRYTREEGKGIFFNYRSIDLTPLEKELLELSKKNVAMGTETYIYGRLLNEGPKVFRTSQFNFEMLEQMSLNIEFGDYVQPFDTMIIELPEAYIKNSRVELPQAGMMMYNERILPDKHEPCFVIINLEKELKAIQASVTFDSELSIKSTLTFDKDSELIEDEINRMDERHLFPNSMATCEEEWLILRKVLRACLNFALLLDEVGVKRLGPNNQKFHEHLKEYVKKANKSGDKERIIKAKNRLLDDPIYYTLEQEVQLYRLVDNEDDLPSDPTGRKVGPHHRRGHYRHQHYGPQNSLKKRIRIPAVFVNKKFFFGDMSDAKAEYKL